MVPSVAASTTAHGRPWPSPPPRPSAWLHGVRCRHRLLGEKNPRRKPGECHPVNRRRKDCLPSTGPTRRRSTHPARARQGVGTQSIQSREDPGLAHHTPFLADPFEVSTPNYTRHPPPATRNQRCTATNQGQGGQVDGAIVQDSHAAATVRVMAVVRSAVRVTARHRRRSCCCRLVLRRGLYLKHPPLLL